MADRAERNDLSALVSKKRAELGLSLRDLAARCINPEKPDAGPLGHNWIHRLEKGTLGEMPEIDHLLALAVGLEEPLGKLQEATASQFLRIDYTWTPDGNVRALVYMFLEMSPEGQARVLALMASWRKLRID